MRLLDHVNVVGRRRGLADATIEAYSGWIRAFLKFAAARYGEWRRPEELYTGDVESFLNHLVMQWRLSASSQNQALNALVFLYTHALENDISADHLGKFALMRSRHTARVPTVLSVDEVGRLLTRLPAEGNFGLMVK